MKFIRWRKDFFLLCVAGLLIFGAYPPGPIAETDTVPFPYYSATPYYNARDKIFVFKGTYREIGRQYARAVPLAGPLDKSRNYLSRLSETSRVQLQKKIRNVGELLAKRFPAALEMMLGIADAQLGYSLQDILLTNSCTTLVNWDSFSACSSIAFRENENIVLGQNLDLGQASHCALAFIIPDNGLAFYASFAPGYLWFTTGVNEAGLCVTGSSINADFKDEFRGDLFPIEMIMFYLLSKARSVDEALGLLAGIPQRGPLREGASLLLADRSGALRNIEVSHDQVVTNTEPVYITTNHYRTAELCSYNRRNTDMCLLLEKNSAARYRRGVEWLKEAPRIARLREFLRDTGGDGAWCQTGREPDIGFTSASYIIDFTHGSFEYWIGPTVANAVHHTISLKFLNHRKVPPPDFPESNSPHQ